MDKREQKRVVVLSCMHKRQPTVKFCLSQMPFVDKIMIYTTTSDGKFLDKTDVIAKAQFKNDPLSFKWNAAVECLAQIDYDIVILLGSDDYCDEKFVNFVRGNMGNNDMIGFSDLYFKQGKEFFYWSGYQTSRKGEPSGAGKAYRREFLERINYNLFHEAKQSGLDGVSWRRCKDANAKIKVFSLMENDLFLCDVKDGDGLTPLGRIQDLIPVKL